MAPRSCMLIGIFGKAITIAYLKSVLDRGSPATNMPGRNLAVESTMERQILVRVTGLHERLKRGARFSMNAL